MDVFDECENTNYYYGQVEMFRREIKNKDEQLERLRKDNDNLREENLKLYNNIRNKDVELDRLRGANMNETDRLKEIIRKCKQEITILRDQEVELKVKIGSLPEQLEEKESSLNYYSKCSISFRRKINELNDKLSEIHRISKDEDEDEDEDDYDNDDDE